MNGSGGRCLLTVKYRKINCEGKSVDIQRFSELPRLAEKPSRLKIVIRDAVVAKEVWERRNAPKKLAILQQLRTHFKEKHEKGVGTPFPRVPPTTPLNVIQV